MQSQRFAVLLCIAALAAPGSIASAGPANPFFLLDNSTDRLLVGDVSDPKSAAPVGNLASAFWADLATGPAPDEVFAINVTSQSIFTLDTADASTVTQATANRSVRSIAYDPDSATLYGLPQTGALELFTVNPATGTTAVIGLTGLPGTAIDAVGMGFAPDTGLIYVTTSTALYAIDPSNANTVLIGSLPNSGFFDIAYNFADGLMYATNANADSLYVVDRSNANLTQVGDSYLNSTSATGLAFPIPEPATLSLLALGGLMLRRRRR